MFLLRKVWAMGQNEPSRGWQSNAQDTLLNHLKTCMLHPETVRQQVINWKLKASPVRRTYQDGFGTNVMPPPLPGLPLASTSQISNQFQLLAYLLPRWRTRCQLIFTPVLSLLRLGQIRQTCHRLLWILQFLYPLHQALL